MTARHWRWLIVLMAAELISGFETSMILASLTAWQRELGDPVKVGWLVSSYLLVAAVSAALFGRLGDIFGRKRMLLVVILLAGLGSFVSAFLPNYGVIVAGRAIQGTAGAIIPLCYGLIRELLPREKVDLGISFIVAAAAGASAVGLLLGGILTDQAGPRSIFWFSAAGSFLVLPIIALGLPANVSRPMTARFDWLGGLLYGPGIAALLYAVSEVRHWATSPLVAPAFVTAVVLLAWWYIHERRHPDPLIDVRLLSNRNLILANLAMFALASGVMQLTQVVSQLVQQPIAAGTGLGYSATFLGAIKLPTILLGVVGSLSVGWLLPRFGHRTLTVVGALMVTISSAVIAFEQDLLWLIIVVFGLASIGVTMVYTTLPAVVVAGAPADRTSEAAGLLAVFRASGQAFGAQIIAVLMSLSLTTLPSGQTFPDGVAYLAAFLFIAVTGAIVLLLALWFRPVARSDGEDIRLEDTESIAPPVLAAPARPT